MIRFMAIAVIAALSVWPACAESFKFQTREQVLAPKAEEPAVPADKPATLADTPPTPAAKAPGGDGAKATPEAADKPASGPETPTATAVEPKVPAPDDKPVIEPKGSGTAVKPEEKPVDSAPRQSLAEQQGIKPTGEVLTYACDDTTGKCDFAE